MPTEQPLKPLPTVSPQQWEEEEKITPSHGSHGQCQPVGRMDDLGCPPLSRKKTLDKVCAAEEEPRGRVLGLCSSALSPTGDFPQHMLRACPEVVGCAL